MASNAIDTERNEILVHRMDDFPEMKNRQPRFGFVAAYFIGVDARVTEPRATCLRRLVSKSPESFLNALFKLWIHTPLFFAALCDGFCGGPSRGTL